MLLPSTGLNRTHESPVKPNEALAAPASSARVLSIDALRGFDMFWIVGGKYAAYTLAACLLHSTQPPAWLKAQLEHTPWNGFSAYDLIMPLFMFIVGAAMPFSFGKHLAAGEPKHAIYRRMAWRFFVFWVLGMMVQGHLLALDWSKFKPFSNVLQAIAIGYVAAGVVLLHVPRRFHLWITAALLVSQWLAMTLIPVPGLGRGVLDDGQNPAIYVERLLLGRFRYDDHYGFVLSIPSYIALVMLGTHAGQWLQSSRPAWRKVAGLLAAGAAGLAMGWFWGLWYPINKHLCTSSMVLWAGGWCFLLLALFYAVIDVLRWRAWAFPLVVIGSNALVAYMVSHLFGNHIGGMSGVLFAGLARHLGRFGWQPFVFACGQVLVLWLILWFLYRHKIFWRV